VDETDSNGADPVEEAEAGEEEGDRARQVRRLRADGERLLEWWGEWMRVLLDAAIDGAEAGVTERDAPHAGDRPLGLGPAKPGQSASGRAWLHILDGPPGPAAPLSATAFTAHDGATIEARAASFEPPIIDSFELRSSHELLITIAVPTGTRPGAYHGHILATGLPEVSLPVRLEVAE
jgi:hypothetical protein